MWGGSDAIFCTETAFKTRSSHQARQGRPGRPSQAMAPRESGEVTHTNSARTRTAAVHLSEHPDMVSNLPFRTNTRASSRGKTAAQSEASQYKSSVSGPELFVKSVWKRTKMTNMKFDINAIQRGARSAHDRDRTSRRDKGRCDRRIVRMWRLDSSMGNRKVRAGRQRSIRCRVRGPAAWTGELLLPYGRP